MTAVRELHQILTGAVANDAITDQAFLIQRWLRQLGVQSEIYGLYVAAELEERIRPLSSYRPKGSAPYVIFHHSIGSEVVERVLEWPVKLIMIYHNITPAHFFEHINPMWAERMRVGREQLELLKGKTALGIGDSAFNEAELIELGYGETAVLPLTFAAADYDLPSNEKLAAEIKQQGPNLLFVGRISPNKRQEDLIKLLIYYRRIAPEAKLYLVGSHWLKSYVNWLEDFIELMGLRGAVEMPGRVSQQDMVTYFRTADLYVSMSEHEGFGKPYIESMYLGTPILAYNAASTPYILQDTGVTFEEKGYERLAELVDLLVKDRPLRERIVEKQRGRFKDFLEPTVYEQFVAILRTAGILA